nr:muconate cycloisomerase 1 [Quercus suber]
MDFIVGTFNYETLYTLHFQPGPQPILSLIRDSPAIGGHSWLAVSKDKKYLYCTVWHPTHPAIAAYKIKDSGREIQPLNIKRVKNMSGYVCVSNSHVYSVGGATGEVFTIGPGGEIGDLIQELDFVNHDTDNMSEKRGAVPHGDFGGLRHGAHSCDLSIDGKSLYVADIGRNCIWTYKINAHHGLTQRSLQVGSWTSDSLSQQSSSPKEEVQHLELGCKHISPRSHDGPRHTWPHPNGKVLYSLQEHSSMVDVFSISPDDGTTLRHLQGVSIIPADKDCKAYWADEVRLSTGPDPVHPRFLYASTRGLQADTKGYVSVFAVREDGTIDTSGGGLEKALDIWETPTSGGIANAIEPAPWRKEFGNVEYLAMTDSEEGWVFILSFDGTEVQEVARRSLGKTDDGQVVGAATAVWL